MRLALAAAIGDALVQSVCQGFGFEDPTAARVETLSRFPRKNTIQDIRLLAVECLIRVSWQHDSRSGSARLREPFLRRESLAVVRKTESNRSGALCSY